MTLNYLKTIECENVKISGYVSDILNSQEYADLTTRLPLVKDTLNQSANDDEYQHFHLQMLWLDFASLNSSLSSLESLYDFPEHFRSYAISEDDVKLFDLSERLSLEAFSSGQTLGEKSNPDNTVVIRPIVEGKDFSDGVAWVRFSSNWACVDKTGTVLFELAPENEPSTDFRGGIAIIDNDKNNNNKGKFYDVNGNLILDISNLNVTNEPYFVDGYCLLDLKNNQGSDYFVVIDKSGNMQFDPIKLITHGNLSDGLYWTLESGIFTYRNILGEAPFTLPNTVQTAYDFSESVLRVESPSGTYYVDKNGNTIFGSSNTVVATNFKDIKDFDGFITCFVEKEGQMYDIEPLEFDANNYDLTKLLQFLFVKCAVVTNTNDSFIKQYTSTANDMEMLLEEFFGIKMEQHRSIVTQTGTIEYHGDATRPYYTQAIEWGARGTYDTWAETEHVTENGDGTLTVVANIFTSVNRDESKSLSRKVSAIIVPNGETYRLMSFKNIP